MTKLSLSLGGSHENRRTRWSPSKWCTHGCHTIRAGEKSSNNQNQNTEKLCSQCVSETIKTLHCVSAIIKTKPYHRACKALLIYSSALLTTNTHDPMNHNVRESKKCITFLLLSELCKLELISSKQVNILSHFTKIQCPVDFNTEE